MPCQLRLCRLTLVTLASWLRCEAAWACASTLHALQLLSAPHIKRCSASSINLACCAAVLSSIECFLRDATTLPCFILVILAWLSCFIGVTQHLLMTKPVRTALYCERSTLQKLCPRAATCAQPTPPTLPHLPPTRRSSFKCQTRWCLWTLAGVFQPRQPAPQWLLCC